MSGSSPEAKNASTDHKRSGWRKVPVWLWVVFGLVAIPLLIVLAPVITIIALIVLATGIVALHQGSRTWLRLRSRRAAIAVTAAAAATTLVAGLVSAAAFTAPPEQPPQADPSPSVSTARPSQATTSPRPSPRVTTTPTPTPVTTVREEVVIEAVPYGQTSYEDGAVPRGQTIVTVAGQNGERSLTYAVTLVDGVEQSRELVSEAMTVEPVAEVTAIGVYDPPPPPPPPAAPSCDPNYADACVPIASDVDCAGGSGDGPAYFDGVARVVGRDIYGLDRDNDGYACE